MSKKILILAALTLMSASMAFAGGEPGKGGFPGQGGAKVTWEQIVAHCINPDQGPFNQWMPKNISITCADQQNIWVQEFAGEVALPGKRVIGAYLMADKYQVDPTQHEYPLMQKPGSCPVYKEVQQTATQVLPLSCDEVRGRYAKGMSLTDVCVDMISSGKSGKASIDQVDTGRRVDTCGGVGGQYPGKK